MPDARYCGITRTSHDTIIYNNLFLVTFSQTLLVSLRRKRKGVKRFSLRTYTLRATPEGPLRTNSIRVTGSHKLNTFLLSVSLMVKDIIVF